MLQISAYHHNKEDGYKVELLILQYSLDEKVPKHYQYMCQYVGNTLCQYFPTDYTYEFAPPNSGTGKLIKLWFRVYLYEWIWDSINLLLYKLGQFPDSCKQILITNLLTKEWIKNCAQPELIERYFTKVGCSMYATR